MALCAHECCMGLIASLLCQFIYLFFVFFVLLLFSSLSALVRYCLFIVKWKYTGDNLVLFQLKHIFIVTYCAGTPCNRWISGRGTHRAPSIQNQRTNIEHIVAEWPGRTTETRVHKFYRRCMPKHIA